MFATETAVHVLYIVIVVAIVVTTHLSPVFDFRGVGRVKRRRSVDEEEAEFDVAARVRLEGERARGLEVIPRTDIAALTTALVLAGVAIAATTGFYAPRLLAPLLSGATWEQTTSAFSVAAPDTVGRLAQVIGAVCLGATALRMARVFMALAALVLVVAAARLSVAFIVGGTFF